MSACASPRRPGEQWTEGDGIHIEVRGLPPPSPFVMIVRLIESLDGCVPVVVHHDRDPVPLYAELAQRGWTIQPIEGDVGEVRLRLCRDS